MYHQSQYCVFNKFEMSPESHFYQTLNHYIFRFAKIYNSNHKFKPKQQFHEVDDLNLNLFRRGGGVERGLKQNDSLLSKNRQKTNL